MKKIFLFLSFLTTILFCQAQKYGYCIISTNYHQGENIRNYVSKVVDVEKLNCSLVSHKNQYGTEKDLVSFYNECIREWFAKRLKSLGRYVDINEYYKYKDGRVRTENQYANCPYGNENSCFMTKEEAEKSRKAFINIVNSNTLSGKETVIEVE